MDSCGYSLATLGRSSVLEGRIFILRDSAERDASGCHVELTPVCGCVLVRGRVLRVVRFACKGFHLDVRHGKACFGRELILSEDLRGLGVGTYLLCGLVRRAVSCGCTDARVRSLHLISRQNTPLRNAFYRNMGFDVTVYRDGSGWARCSRLGDLRQQHDLAKVSDVPSGVQLPPVISDYIRRTALAPV